MTDFWIKQNDTLPAIRVEIVDENDAVVDLSTGIDAIVFNMRDVATQTTKIDNQAATIVDGPNGVVEYQWSTGDTDTVDDYEAEFEIGYTVGVGGGTETFPNKGYIDIKVVDDIA